MDQINLYAPITPELLNELITTTATLPDSHPIQINMASHGGDVPAGVQMYNYLKRFEKLTIKAMGNIDSIAVIVYLSAKRRLATNNTLFFLHGIALDSHGPISLRTKDLDDYKEKLSHEVARYSDIFVKETYLDSNAIPLEEVKSILEGHGDRTLTANEALHVGVVNCVVAPTYVQCI